MKLVHPELSRAIIDDTVDYTEWIIEATERFAAFVYELKNQCDGNDGRYVLMPIKNWEYQKIWILYLIFSA